MSSLESDAPVFAAVAAPPDPPVTPRLARRVYLVIVDGLGHSRSLGLPFLDGLRARGVDAVARSTYPTWSRPNYVAILTGAPPIATGIRTNYHPMSIPLDSIMARVRAAGLRVAWISDYPMIPPLFLGPGVVDLDALDFGEARLIAPAGLAWPFDDVRRQHTPAEVAADVPPADLVLIVLGDVDRAGHMYGGASSEYRDAAREVDRALGVARGGVELARDAIVVVADHGHVDAGGHGGLEPEVVHVPLIAAGAGIRRGEVSDARLIDIAPTIAALLGVAAPHHALGRTLVEILAPEAAGRAASDPARILPLAATLDREVEREQDAIATRRLWRIPVVAVALVAFALLGRALARRGALKLDARIVPALAVAIVLIAFTAMVRGQLSPSAVPPKDALIHRIVAFVIAGVVVQVAAALWRTRSLAAATGVAWIGLAVALAPVALYHAIAPQPDVPTPAGIVASPALDLAGAAGCAAVALTLVVELVRTKSRSASGAQPGSHAPSSRSAART